MDLYGTDARTSREREQLEPFIVQMLSALCYNSHTVLEMLIYDNQINLLETQFWLKAVPKANKPTFHSSLYKITDQGG